jgi:septal ring factor EnvC (AmiA/AmiB activator)
MKRKEEAVVHRKRSSRIALKESEKEQEFLTAKRRAEEDEKTSRARRAEARRQKEEADRIKRENAREQRRKEREAKQAEANTRYEYSAPIHVFSMHLASTDAPIDIMNQEHSSSAIPSGKLPSLSAPVPANGTCASTSGSRTPAEDWELDCEICGRRGINQVRFPLISCS